MPPNLTRPKSARPNADTPPVVRHGFVTSAPASLTDEFQVRVPSFDENRVFQIRRWMPRGTSKPAVGDEVLVVVDDRQEPWVVAWWPA